MNYIKKNFKIDYIISFTFAVSIFFWNINLLGSYLKFFFLLNFFLIFFDNKKFSNNYFYRVTLISLLITFIFFYHIIFDIISLKFYFEQNTIFNVVYVFLCFFIVFHFSERILLNIRTIIIIYLFILSLIFFCYSIYELITLEEYSVKNLFNFNKCTSTGNRNKLTEIFTENSHLAITIIPSIFFLLFIFKSKLRFLCLLIILIIYFLNYSTTLIITTLICFFIFFFHYKNKSITFIVIPLCIFCLSILFIDKNCAKRFEVSFLNNNFYKLNTHQFDNLDKNYDLKSKNFFDLSTKNLSAQVLLNATIVTYKSLINKPFGFGFQNYYKAFELSKVYNIKFDPLVYELNKKDGASTFLKILVEYGLFSVIFFYIIALIFFDKKINIETKFFIIPIILSSFFRGVGYFNGGFLILILLSLTIILKKIKMFKDLWLKN